MGSIFHPKYVPLYFQAARDHGLAFFVPRWSEERLLQEEDIDKDAVKGFVQMMQVLEEEGLPLVDDYASIPLKAIPERLEATKKAFAELKPGITLFVLHGAVDTPELRAIAPDWEGRVGDYEVFMSEELRDFIQKQGIQVIGYRELQALVPSNE
jgi:hypothetical protein